MSDGALTWADLERTWDNLMRPAPPPPDPNSTVDFDLLHKHGIGYFIDGDLVLFSSTGMRRAKEVGAIKNISHG